MARPSKIAHPGISRNLQTLPLSRFLVLESQSPRHHLYSPFGCVFFASFSLAELLLLVGYISPRTKLPKPEYPSPNYRLSITELARPWGRVTFSFRRHLYCNDEVY